MDISGKATSRVEAQYSVLAAEKVEAAGRACVRLRLRAEGSRGNLRYSMRPEEARRRRSLRGQVKLIHDSLHLDALHQGARPSTLVWTVGAAGVPRRRMLRVNPCLDRCLVTRS